jgi:putative ABC transport system permease protein
MSLQRLVISNISTRKVRTLLTISAVALAVSLVVAVTSGYKSFEGAIYKFLITYLGTTDVQITHKSDFRATIPESLIEDLRKDRDVAAAFGRLETDTGLVDKEGKPVPGRVAQLIGLDRPIDSDITRTRMNAGDWFDVSRGQVAVIDQQAADALKVNVGDKIPLPTADGQKRELTVVGIAHKPAILAEKVQWIYLPLRTAQELTSKPSQVSRILIDLKEGASEEAFTKRWEPKLAAVNPQLQMRLRREARKRMDDNLQDVHIMSFLAGAISLVAAAFVVFSTLSMGVTERQRSLAMLRAIGAYRSQLARLVVGEGFLLGTFGAVAGVPLGLAWTWILTRWRSNFFSAGVIVDWLGIGAGVVVAALAAVIVGLIPAWSASRVDPLEAMTPLAKPPRLRGALISAAVGLVLLSLDSVLILKLPVDKNVKFIGHFVIGLPGLVIGFFLISPLIVWIVDRLLGWAVPLILRVPSNLLRHQLSGGLWRAAGTGSALMIGLMVLVALQTVGNSALQGWKLPTRFPDIFIYAGQGLPMEQWPKLREIEGIKKDEVLPIAVAFPGLPKGWFGLAAASILPDATMFLGVDPNLAFKMMELDFREGTPEQAAAMLNKGNHIVVTEEFRVLKGVHVGDKMPLMTTTGMKEFTIAGVVWSPGIDVMVTMFDMGRMFDQRTAASVFGSVQDAKNLFGAENVHFFACNLEMGVDKEVVLKKVKEQVGERGWKAGDVRKIKYDIEQTFRRLLLLASTVAFSAMAVAAMGVTNTVMASVRSRQWQFGVLRSIGVTRGQLLRLVLCEAILLGFVGAALGLASGLLLSVNDLGLSKNIIGYVPGISIPWDMLAIGVAVVLAVAILASLWPAAAVARAEPLELLQAGRGAA